MSNDHSKSLSVQLFSWFRKIYAAVVRASLRIEAGWYSQSNASAITEAQLTQSSEQVSVTVNIRSGSGHPESGNRARRRNGA
jgi:hypothetical protein